MRKGMTEEDMGKWIGRITGPSTGPDALIFTIEWGGQAYHSSCLLSDDPGRLARNIQEAKNDLASYVGGFATFGCGWPGHEFDGDVTDPSLYLECVKCGAAKLVNQRLPALVVV